VTSSEIGLCIQPGELRDETRRVLSDLQLQPAFELDETVPPERLTAALAEKQSRILLLGLDAIQGELSSLFRKIRAPMPQLKIVALHSSADPKIILAAMRAGAAEFLHPPLADTMRAALERIASHPGELDSIPRQGRVIGFLSSKGGCGATTLACHVASELRRQTRGEVLLADLDFTSGMVAFLMKTTGEYSILDAVQNLYRLDASIWKGLVGKGNQEVSVMQTPAALSQDVRLEEGDIQRVLRFMRSQHDWTLVDLGRSLTRLSRAAIEEVDRIFLVSTLEVPALYGVKNIIRLFTETAGDTRKLEIVLNRAPASMDISVKELEETLGRHIYATLPNDYGSLYESYAKGTLLGSNNRLAQHFARFASKLAGIEPVKVKKRFSLFG
jgi:pilus assembly protein CpaE